MRDSEVELQVSGAENRQEEESKETKGYALSGELAGSTQRWDVLVPPSGEESGCQLFLEGYGYQGYLRPWRNGPHGDDGWLAVTREGVDVYGANLELAIAALVARRAQDGWLRFGVKL